MKREKGRELIGEGERGDGKWGLPTHYFLLNPLKGSGIRLLRFKVFSASQV